jgi:hypothetical protein
LLKCSLMARPAWPPPTTKVFIFSDIIRILTAYAGRT